MFTIDLVFLALLSTFDSAPFYLATEDTAIIGIESAVSRMAGAVIGVLLTVASIPMMEKFYADKIEAKKVYTNVKIGAGSTLANESSFSTVHRLPSKWTILIQTLRKPRSNPSILWWT